MKDDNTNNAIKNHIIDIFVKEKLYDFSKKSFDSIFILLINIFYQISSQILMLKTIESTQFIINIKKSISLKKSTIKSKFIKETFSIKIITKYTLKSKK